MIVESDKGKEITVYTSGAFSFSGKVIEIDNDHDWLTLEDLLRGVRIGVDMLEILAVERKNW